MTMELTNDNMQQWIAWATDRIVELEQAYDDLHAILAPLYSRFEHDEAGCVSCSACPVCGIEPGTQFMKGVSHFEGCKLAEVMRNKRPVEDVLRSIAAEVPQSEWDKLPG